MEVKKNNKKKQQQTPKNPQNPPNPQTLWEITRTTLLKADHC